MKNLTRKLALVFAFIWTLNSYSQNNDGNKLLEDTIQGLVNSENLKKSLLTPELLDATTSNLSKKELQKITADWIMDGDKVKVMANCKDGHVSDLKSELEALGMKEAKIYGRIVNGWISLDKLIDMEQCKFLKKVMPELTAYSNFTANRSNNVGHKVSNITKNNNVKHKTSEVIRTGNVVSQAVDLFRSDILRAALGADGTGVKIGIISVSYDIFGGAAEGIRNGELPGSSNPNGYTKEVVVLSEIRNEARANDEGRAMAELIHDIAPGAELFFWSGLNGTFDFADGIRALAAAGCDIIVDDISQLAPNPFQISVIGRAVNEVVANGVSFFSSAGNRGNNALMQPFDINPIFFDNAVRPAPVFGFDEGQQFQEVRIESGEIMDFFLHWSDPSNQTGLDGPAPDTDLVIFAINADVFREEGRVEVIARSTQVNADTGRPLDRLIVEVAEDEEALNVLISIAKISGPDPELIYLSENVFRSNLATIINRAPTFGAPTVRGHKNTTGAIAVGRNPFFNTPDFGRNYRVNDFSSSGGIPILIDENGKDIPPIVLQKPEIVGPDTVNNTFFGFDSSFDGDSFPNFFGTSASAPNLAAVAALMLSLNPSLTPNQIREVLLETATDMDDNFTPEFDEGFDFRTGFGFAQGDLAFASVSTTPVVYRFELIDRKTKEVLQTLREGIDIDIANFEENTSFNINASVAGGNNEIPLLVQLKLTGTQFLFNADRKAPYTFINGRGRPLLPEVGNYTIEATAISKVNPRASLKNKLILNFSFSDSSKTQEKIASKHTNQTNITKISILPNPARNLVTISLSGADELTSVSLYDMKGSEVYTSEKIHSNDFQLDLSRFDTGLYILNTIDNTGERFSSKLGIIK